MELPAAGRRCLDEGVVVPVGEQSQLRAGCRTYPADHQPHLDGVLGAGETRVGGLGGPARGMRARGCLPAGLRVVLLVGDVFAPVGIDAVVIGLLVR